MGLWQLFALNLPGQLLKHLLQQQAREGDILGGGESLGDDKKTTDTLEMEY